MGGTIVLIIVGILVLIFAIYLVKKGKSEKKLESESKTKPEKLEKEIQDEKIIDTKLVEPKEKVIEQEKVEEKTEEKEEKIETEVPVEEEKKGIEEKPVEKVEVEDEVKKREEDKKALVLSFKQGLKNTRGGFISRLTSIFKGKKEIDPKLLEEIEEIMITSDVGVKTTEKLISQIKEGLDKKELFDPDKVWSFLENSSKEIININVNSRDINKFKPFIIMIVGVNGVGKTTTIGKLANKYKEEGKKVLLIAADTFRAAAVQQLEIWAKRVTVDIISGKPGSDPSAIVFDGVKKAKEENYDVVLIDTAGRLHTKVPLMDELKKIKRVIPKIIELDPHEIMLVIDGNTGQNSIQQVRQFHEALELTGLIITKLDGTAKGGAVIGICDELHIPVRFIGIGEKMEDLKEFDANSFVEALFSKEDEEDKAVA